MIDLDIALPAITIELTRIAERQLVHTAIDSSDGSGIRHQDLGDNEVTVYTSTNHLADDVSISSLCDQVTGMQQRKRFDDLELSRNLLDACDITKLVSPLITKRIAITVNTSNTTFVKPSAYRTSKITCAVLMNLFHFDKLADYRSYAKSCSVLDRD